MDSSQPTHNLPPRRAAVELVAASLLWGFGFVATRWALESANASMVTALRFTVAALISVPLVLLNPKWRRHLTGRQARSSIIPGILLGLPMLIQTIGLNYTTVTKSGFITTLYIVFIPLFEAVLYRRVPSGLQIFYTLVALVGAALMCEFYGGALNFGDLLTLLCAAGFAFHIIWLERAAAQATSAFVFNFYQILWAAVAAWIAAVLLGSVAITPLWTTNALIGLFTISVGCTIIAFFLQVRSQQVLKPSVVSLLFLMESPYAALFAYFCCGEIPSATQLLGAALIMGAALGTIRMT